MKYKVTLGRFPYGNVEDSRCVDWLIAAGIYLSRRPDVELQVKKINDTPITMTRNKMIEDCKADGTDILVWVDSDMAPDCELGQDPEAKPFLSTSLAFMLDHKGPCVVAAPYCGPPPHENVYVFQWTQKQGDNPNADWSELAQYTREDAMRLTGIREVAALPTGLMLIDMRAFKGMPYPHTYYEWNGDGPSCPHCGVKEPGPQAEKGSTEDVTLTRDLSLAGVPVYCNWDAWAGHVKQKVVRKPRPFTADMLARRMHAAIGRKLDSGERLRDVKPGRFQADADRAMRESAAGTVQPHRGVVVQATSCPPGRARGSDETRHGVPLDTFEPVTPVSFEDLYGNHV